MQKYIEKTRFSDEKRNQNYVNFMIHFTKKNKSAEKAECVETIVFVE